MRTRPPKNAHPITSHLAVLEFLEERRLLTATPECIDFDGLQVGTEIKVGTSIVADSTGFRAEIRGEPFTWSNNQQTSDGFARVDNNGQAGGSGRDLVVNNILLDFKFEATLPLSGLRFNFGELGGNLNVQLNGDFVNFQDFQNIHNTFIGGAFVTVPVGGSGQDQGVVNINGPIYEFKIGGQELWIDDVCMDEDMVPQRFDFGDAPQRPYPVTFANGGAFHHIQSGVHLGERVDPEGDGQPSPLATRDDLTPSAVVDDEDGVIFTSAILPGNVATVDVIASTKGYLNAWIDFNQNGVWEGGAENVFSGQLLSAGLNSLTFTVPKTAEPTLEGPTFSRWRFSTTHQILSPKGGGIEGNEGIPNGEVEDHRVFVQQPDPDRLDFGDAPKSYGTLWVDDGARHRIDPDLYLGKQIDPEPDGIPSRGATGDDLHAADDEDGVEFLTMPLIPDREAKIRVTASNRGILDVWLDVDRNGHWTDSEQVIISQPLTRGANDLSFHVPAWALPDLNSTFSRFRFSSKGGLAPTGLAADGEVEDYAVMIGERDPQGPLEPLVEIAAANLGVLQGSTHFPEPIFIPVEGGGREWVQMLSPGSESLVGGPLGTPAVPVYRRLIAVPAGAKVTVRMTNEPDVARSLVAPLIPFQETALDDEIPPDEFFDDPDSFQYDEEAYNSGGFPREVVKVTPLGNLRDVEVALLEVATAHYDPANQVLDVFAGVEWEVEFTGGQGFLPDTALHPFENSSAHYETLLNSAVLGEYVYPGEVTSIVGEELLILTHPDFREAAEKLAEWKRDKGIMTSVFDVGAGTARDTKEAIKDLIQTRWDTTLTRASYVLFLGDTEFIPTYYRKSYYAGGNGGPHVRGNQDVAHNTWRSLGTANFTGHNEYVDLWRPERKGDITDPGATVADAVRFVNLGTGIGYVVDNNDPGFSIVTGTWYESAATDEYNGSSLWTREDEARVRFEAPSLPEGQYEVFARWSGRKSDGSYYDRDSDARYTIASSNTGTDTPYTLVAGGFLNLLPDLANGRIPVDTAAQAMTVVDKIIDYEKTPPGSMSDDAFYDNAMLASQFQGYRNGDPTGRDNRAFIEESERSRDTLMAAGKTVERIYTKTEDWGETAQEPNRYYDGTLLPNDLRIGSGFAWSGDTSDVVDAFNDGRFLVVHRDHGSPSGWGHPGFWTSTVNTLTNGAETPVVYSINCSSGLFDNESSGSLTNSSVGGTYFAEALLRSNNGGAVGIIGDTRNSNTWSNTAFLRGLIDATWQNNDPGYGGASIRRLGDIMNYAKQYTVMQIGVSGSTPEVELQFGLDTINLYHVYGDPTLEMHTSNPHRLVLDGGIVYERIDPLTLTFEYAVSGAEITAYQVIGGQTVPLGRQTSENGGGKMPLIREADPDAEILFSACLEGAICRPLHEIGLLGDYNRDGELNAPDLNLLGVALRDGIYVGEYDLTEDAKLNLDDRDAWLRLKGALPGDTDLNGKVNFADFLVLSANFGSHNATWEMGDSNLDGEVEFGDFLELSANYGVDPTAADEFFLRPRRLGLDGSEKTRQHCGAAGFEIGSSTVAWQTRVCWRQVRVICYRREGEAPAEPSIGDGRGLPVRCRKLKSPGTNNLLETRDPSLTHPRFEA